MYHNEEVWFVKTENRKYFCAVCQSEKSDRCKLNKYLSQVFVEYLQKTPHTKGNVHDGAAEPQSNSLLTTGLLMNEKLTEVTGITWNWQY